jgi:hypothetical protein
MDAGGTGVPAAEVAARFDHLASVTPGERKTPAEMSREEYEALPVVYHGGISSRASSRSARAAASNAAWPAAASVASPP